MANKKLRLLVTKKCNRNCSGCCNNDWDLDNLPQAVLDGSACYSEIILTGGEPLLAPSLLMAFCDELKKRFPATPIFVYTAFLHKRTINAILSKCAGITLTLHTKADIKLFSKMYPHGYHGPRKSLRLNVFGKLPVKTRRAGWQVKDGMKWIRHCPLPNDEIFRQHILF